MPIISERFRIKFTLLSLCLVSVMCTGLIAPALPLITSHYSYLPNAKTMVALMVTIPQLVIAILSPMAGWVMRKSPKKKLAIMIALFFYGISGFACAFVENIKIILILRAVLGLCIATILSLSSALIAEYFDGQERTGVMGLQTVVMSMGTITYNLLGGICADINWHYNFLLYATALFIIPAMHRYVRKNSQSKDSVTQKKFSIGENNIIKAKARFKSIPNPPVIKQNNAIILLLYFCSILSMMMYYMIPLQLPFLLYESLDMTAKKVSFVLAAETLSTAFFALLYRKVKTKISFDALLVLSLSFMSCAYLIIFLNQKYSVIVVAMLIYGVGMGAMMPNIISWLVNVTKPHNRAVVIGGMFSAIYCGKFTSYFILAQLSKFCTIIQIYGVASITMMIIAAALTTHFKNQK